MAWDHHNVKFQQDFTFRASSIINGRKFFSLTFSSYIVLHMIFTNEIILYQNYVLHHIKEATDKHKLNFEYVMRCYKQNRLTHNCYCDWLRNFISFHITCFTSIASCLVAGNFLQYKASICDYYSLANIMKYFFSLQLFKTGIN